MKPSSTIPMALATLLPLAACGPNQGLQVGPSATASAGLAALEPPPPGQGVQLYIPPFDVPQGKEVQRNYFMKLPVEQGVTVNKVEIRYNTGSHHCNLFKSDTENQPDHVEDSFDAIPYDKYNMFSASQRGDFSWKLPEGVGIPFKARQQLLVQSHFVNASTQKTPGDKGEVRINLWFAPPEAKLMSMGMLFAINKNLDIPPRGTQKASKLIDLNALGIKGDVKIAAMTGHYHSRGKNFTVQRYDENKVGETVYQNVTWDDPPFQAYDKPLELKSNQKLFYTSEFVNNTDQVIKFGPHVENEEHSNLFLYFYPGPDSGKAIYDLAGGPFTP